MKDIETRGNLETLLAEFYKIATIDKEIRHHFDELNSTAHLPVIVDFWEKALFGKPIYYGNPLAVHQTLHRKSPLMLEHFQRWVEIFHATVDNFFTGELADAAKLRAKMIAHSLNRNLNSSTEISA